MAQITWTLPSFSGITTRQYTKDDYETAVKKRESTPRANPRPKIYVIFSGSFANFASDNLWSSIGAPYRHCENTVGHIAAVRNGVPESTADGTDSTATPEFYGSDLADLSSASTDQHYQEPTCTLRDTITDYPPTPTPTSLAHTAEAVTRGQRHKQQWSSADDKMLTELKGAYQLSWLDIAAYFKDRSIPSISQRYYRLQHSTSSTALPVQKCEARNIKCTLPKMKKQRRLKKQKQKQKRDQSSKQQEVSQHRAVPARKSARGREIVNSSKYIAAGGTFAC